MPRDLRITNDAGSRLLERFGHVELRWQLEEALALARAGVPVSMPPILAANLQGPERGDQAPSASFGSDREQRRQFY